MDQAIMEDETARRERLDALLQQEKSYCCPNYTDPDFCRQEQERANLKPTPLRIIEECAKLMTDLSLEPPPHFHRTTSPASVTSTAVVGSTTPQRSKFPSAMHHTCLVTWRRQMSQWAYQATDTFGLDRELVAIAFGMLDRYLSREIRSAGCQDLEREDFQLYSMCCVYIAIKILEPNKKLSISALIDMSRGYYCAEDITETELEILEVLQWRISAPTPLSFIQELAVVMPSVFTKDFMETCKELAELVVMDEFFISYKASTIAAAVVLTAGRQHKQPTEDLKTQAHEWFICDMDDVALLCNHFER